MTIVLRTARPGFAVIAAERKLSRSSNSISDWPAKVAWHPAGLPLAFGVAQRLDWCIPGSPDDRWAPTSVLLEELAAECDSIDSLDLKTVAGLVFGRLQPGYAKVKENTYITIALVVNGKAEVGMQPIGSGTQLIEGHDLGQRVPPGFYNQDDWDFLHDQTVTNPAEVVQRARFLVEKGIAYEFAIKGRNEDVGGPVDVVLVSDQARLYSFKAP